MRVVEVFADVACPFTHVGLRTFVRYRTEHRRDEPRLRVRAWPLELVNHHALDGHALTPKVEALRRDVDATSFAGFHEAGFPTTTLPALAAEAAAYRLSVEAGERFSLAVRDALFEDGHDVSDPGVLGALCDAQGVPRPTEADATAVDADYADGQRRGVTGSPYFVTAEGGFFCPSLDIHTDDQGFDVRFDPAGFEAFVDAAFA